VKKTLLILLLTLVLLLGCELFSMQLRDVSHLTGWLMVIVAVSVSLFLMLRSYAKTISPEVRRFYYNVHLVLGYLMLVIFAVHVGFNIPNGSLEWVISGLFLTMVLSGIMGVVVQGLLHRYPVGSAHQTLSPDQLPVYRAQLREDAEKIIYTATEEQGDTRLAEYYSDNIRYYFNEWVPPIRTLYRHRKEVATLLGSVRFQGKECPQYQQSYAKFRELIQEKSRVEFEFAWDSVLFSWRIIHKVVAFSLVIFVILHIVLVLVFSG